MADRRFWRLAGFRFDSETRILTFEGRPVPLQTKAAEALSILIDAGGEVVTKDRLRSALWPPDTVDEGSLYQTIYVLRRSLDSVAHRNGPIVETVGRTGYRLAAPLEPEVQPAAETRVRRRALFPLAFAMLALVVLASLAGRLAPPQASDASLSPAARRAHALGHSLLAQRTVESIRKSIVYFKEVVAADPQSAVGYADLAGAYTILLGYLGIDEMTGYRYAETYARAALARDPRNAAALTSLGFIVFERDGAYAAALQKLHAAAESDPRFSPAWESLAIVDLARGEVKTAQVEIERAVQLDPGSAPYLLWQGIAQYFAGNFSAAAQTLRASSDLADQPITLYYLFLTYEVEGDVKGEQAALQELGRIGVKKPKLDAVAAFIAFHEAQREAERARALTEIRRVAKNDPDARFLLAVTYGLLRRDRDAMAVLRRQRERDIAFVDYRFLPIDPHFRRLYKQRS